MGSSNRRRNSIMWLDLVATGVTILSHFRESLTKGYLVLPTGGSFEPSIRHSNDWLAWRCCMQQHEAACGGVGGGPALRLAHCLLTQSLNRSGFSDEPTCKSSLHLRLRSIAVCGALWEEGWEACCTLHTCTYCTQPGSPSSEGQHNLIVRSHLTLSEVSCDSLLDLFHSLDVLGLLGFKELLVHRLGTTRCAGQLMSPGFCPKPEPARRCNLGGVCLHDRQTAKARQNVEKFPCASGELWE